MVTSFQHLTLGAVVIKIKTLKQAQGDGVKLFPPAGINPVNLAHHRIELHAARTAGG